MAKRPPSFLVMLLRRGAPALATATSELSDEVGDPTPIRALRRIQQMSGPVDATYRDNLLLRAARYVALVPLVYRLFAVPGAFGVYVAAHGMTGIGPVGLVTLGSVGLSLYGIRWMLRSAPFQPQYAARLLAVDLAFTLLAPLAVGALVPGSVYSDAMTVPGKHLLGEVALLALALGMPAAAALAVVSFPIRMLASLFATGHGAPGDALATFPSILGVLFTATGALVLIGLGTRLALAYGIRNGRIAERARQHRVLHDSVLQTLEAIALANKGDPVARLAEVQRLARAQSMELRQTIENEASDRSEAGSRPLGEKLASLAAEMARDGLRAQLVIAELDDDTLSEVRQIAIRDAVRESLRNTLKHAGTDKVVVRVEEQEGGVAVITRDHGAGFSLDSRPAGFGISESITARLNEVGGTARVESAPGNGTRVTLWVPF
ncbi:sensor histidine kinase [Amycolatopsis umgeniensis]|uniref:Signal transduction histidine kinase n=1 Tax=Amycolatopsis umgeniensis TaxID=336628 RepID=A0A841B6D4_9PSEU|nr:ATP-binding protein [Amycolatopsis umgeniensis]MBB5854078.1 signal transduction histidine kinase [Amycolatopsis umgeniensis]